MDESLVEADVGDGGALNLISGSGEVDRGPIVKGLVGRTGDPVERAGGHFATGREHALGGGETEERVVGIDGFSDQLNLAGIDELEDAGVAEAVGETELGEGGGVGVDKFLAVDGRGEGEGIPRWAAARFPERDGIAGGDGVGALRKFVEGLE